MGFYPQPKPSSRLQAKKAETKLATVDEKTFKHEVWFRDKGWGAFLNAGKCITSTGGPATSALNPEPRSCSAWSVTSW